MSDEITEEMVDAGMEAIAYFHQEYSLQYAPHSDMAVAVYKAMCEAKEKNSPARG